MTPLESPGFFGKVVSRGDFVRRRLPDDFVACWDDWLQRSMEASRQELGDGWLAAYLSAPLWRFALGAGVCGDAPWHGVIMPSVDRVGRHFPLTIAVAADPLRADLKILSVVGGWFDTIEKISLAALSEEFSLAALDAALLDLGAPLAEEVHLPIFAEIPDGPSIALFLPGIVTTLTRTAPAQHSLWWTEGSAQVQPCLLVHRALPPASAFAAMMNGTWKTSDDGIQDVSQ